MDIYEALYTTRAMRRVKPDPVPLDVQAKIMDAAVRAPSGGNQQNWRFLLVDDPAIKAKIGPLYRDAVDKLWTTFYASQLEQAHATPEDPASISFLKVQKSAQWLADHYEEVPLYLFPFIQHDPTGGSIFPAVWSAMLAVPKDEGWVMAAMVSMGYPTGTWGVAQRSPAHEVTARNQWGTPPGFSTPEPLWRPQP